MMISTERFNPMDYPLAFAWPRLLSPGSAWVPHTPFAMALIGLCRPDRLVELGALHGDSYCSMCQAVQALKLPTRCTAIDTWQGDPHNGMYGPDVLQTLREHHDPLYAEFSNLWQTTFDEAVLQMKDGSIDLLHIDGFHTYDAVKHDYETWKPKLSRRGVVMFHDTRVRESGFGVWKLWEEVTSQFPNFEFHHSFGLGVLAVGAEAPPALLQFLEMANRDPDTVRSFFRYIGDAVDNARMAVAMMTNVQRLQDLLDKRKKLVGETINSMDMREAFRSPLRYMEHMMVDVQALTIGELRLRGFDVRADAPPTSPTPPTPPDKA
ncbi:hypothetical protein BH09PLA1_BH09PLA1_03830 [soil metagenome]